MDKNLLSNTQMKKEMTIKRINPDLGGKTPSKGSISRNFLLFQFEKC